MYTPKARDFLSWDADGTMVLTQCDAILSWTDTLEANVTEDPVEDGTIITDHIAVLPAKLEVTIAVSQTPLYGGRLKSLDILIQPSRFVPTGLFALTQALEGVIGTGLNAVAGVVGINQGAPPGASTWQRDAPKNAPANDLQDKLISCITNGYLCTITLGVNRTAGRKYEGYVMTSLVRTNTSEDGELSTFAISLKKIKVVQTEVAALPVPNPLAAAKALASKVLKGNQPATLRDEAPPEKEKTLLKMIKDSF